MKKKIMITVIACLLCVAVLGVSVWLIVVDVTSRKYNLIKVNTSNVPDIITAAPKELDVKLSDITMHYAVYGSGSPLILLHGNGNSNKDLEQAARYLANDYTVYALDSRCHGQSTVTDKISYELMAKDVGEFVTALGLDKPMLIGHSDGGITALSLAINYPDCLGGLIACGANSTPSGLKSYFTTAVKISYNSSKKITDAMMLEQPDFSLEQLSGITTPCYILAGEFDIVKLTDTAFIANAIPNSRVAIIKWGNHSSYIKNDGKQIYTLATDFFSTLK